MEKAIDQEKKNIFGPLADLRLHMHRARFLAENIYGGAEIWTEISDVAQNGGDASIPPPAKGKNPWWISRRFFGDPRNAMP